MAAISPSAGVATDRETGASFAERPVSSRRGGGHAPGSRARTGAGTSRSAPRRSRRRRFVDGDSRGRCATTVTAVQSGAPCILQPLPERRRDLAPGLAVNPWCARAGSRRSGSIFARTANLRALSRLPRPRKPCRNVRSMSDAGYRWILVALAAEIGTDASCDARAAFADPMLLHSSAFATRAEWQRGTEHRDPQTINVGSRLLS
jgi:hypothetical protein